MTFDDVTRLVIAIAALLLLAGTVCLWRVVRFPGRRVVLAVFAPALLMVALFSLVAAFDWLPFDWRRWLSQVADTTMLAAVGVALSVIRDTEQLYPRRDE